MLKFKKDIADYIVSLEDRHPTFYFIVDLVANIAVILVLVYTVRTYLISPFQVLGPSMCNTLNYINEECKDGFGEYLIVNKAVYHDFWGKHFGEPERGDIIVFRPPHNEEDFYIKRIIGLPGEEIKIQNGKVYLFNKEHQSGMELPENYLSPENKNRTYPSPSRTTETYKIPNGYYFVLGDNRNKSTDSRLCFKGPGDPDCRDEINHFLPSDKIEGKAWVVLWPFNKLRYLSNPKYEGS